MGSVARQKAAVMQLARHGAAPTRVDSADGSNRVSCRIEAGLATTIAAGQRLIEVLQQGMNEFVLTSVDGSVSARVRLTIDGLEPVDRPMRGGEVTVDWSRSIVANGPSRVALSNTELRLLAALLEGNEAPVSRAKLIERVWPADALPIQDRENALAVYVCSLRKRLGTIGLGTALQTVRRVGYRVTF